MAYGCLIPIDVALSVCELAATLALGSGAGVEWYYACKPKVFAENSPAKGECDNTGNSGGEDERFLENRCVRIQDAGWDLKLISETP